MLLWLRQASLTYAAHFSAVRVVTGQWILGIRLIKEDRAFTDDRGKERNGKRECQREGEEGRHCCFRIIIQHCARLSQSCSFFCRRCCDVADPIYSLSALSQPATSASLTMAFIHFSTHIHAHLQILSLCLFFCFVCHQ